MRVARFSGTIERENEMSATTIIKEHIEQYTTEIGHIERDIELYRANGDPFNALTHARVLAMVKREALQKVLNEVQGS